MISASVREWEYIAVDDGSAAGTISRRVVDSLVAVARRSQLGGSEGERILLNGHRRLRAQQVVGVLASRSATLEILPKIDGLDDGTTRRQLIHMLARVFDLDVAGGALVGLDWQNHDMLEILVGLFCDRLLSAIHRGLPRQYMERADDLSTLRGRLDVRRQFTVLAASPQKLACSFDELSPDTALNQIMKAAVTRLAGISKSAGNQRRLAELLFAFSDVSNVPTGALAWNRVVLDRTNAIWSSLLSLARLLLGNRLQTTSSGDAMGFSLLFAMNNLFEEFVGRELRHAMAGANFSVHLQGPRDHALISDAGTRRFATRPDIVLSVNQSPRLIIDTKWKRLKGFIDDPKQGVGQGDVYQMMAYAQIYQCERLMLLYPHHDEIAASEGVQSVHRIQGTQDTRLCVASISLSELAGFRNRLLALVRAMLDVPMAITSAVA